MRNTCKYLFILSLVFFGGCGRTINTVKKDIPIYEPSPEDNQEIVFEGTVITTGTHSDGNTLFSSCMVEVNTVFQGRLDEKVIEVITEGGSIGDMIISISHGISLPQKNQTAIFRVKDLEVMNMGKELIGLTPFKLYLARGLVKRLFPNTHNVYEEIHIEKDVYQKLESDFGRKKKTILLPATFDEVQSTILREAASCYRIEKKDWFIR